MILLITILRIIGITAIATQVVATVLPTFFYIVDVPIDIYIIVIIVVSDVAICKSNSIVRNILSVIRMIRLLLSLLLLLLLLL